MPRAEVLYNGEKICGLSIVQRTRVGEAWVEGPSAQLRNVERGARLCVTARTRSLEPDGRGDR